MPHTPGPWQARGVNVDAGAVHDEGIRVAKCWSSTFAPPPTEAEANARLIAEAPALLVAAELILIQLDGVKHHDTSPAYAALRAAVARAKGET